MATESTRTTFDEHDAKVVTAQERVGARFEVVRSLGDGGMGSVYEAFDRVRGEHVALKILRVAGADSLYRFKREFRALADHSHPNLVTLFEPFARESDWFFTMELVHGSTLLTWLRSVELPMSSRQLIPPLLRRALVRCTGRSVTA